MNERTNYHGCGVFLAGLGLFVAGVGFGSLYLIAAVKAVW